MFETALPAAKVLLMATQTFRYHLRATYTIQPVVVEAFSQELPLQEEHVTMLME